MAGGSACIIGSLVAVLAQLFSTRPTSPPAADRPSKSGFPARIWVGCPHSPVRQHFDSHRIQRLVLDLVLRGQLAPKLDVLERRALVRTVSKRGFLPAELLVAANYDIAVLRIQLNQPRLATGLLARDQRCARPAERIKHGVAALAAVPDGALDQLDWLHRRVQIVDVRLLDEPNVALVASAAPKMIRAFLPAVEDRFVLPLIVRPPHRERVLRPHDESRPVPARLAEHPLQRVDL